VTVTEVPLRTLPRASNAWDHLRRRRLPFHVPLNEWRRDHFLARVRAAIRRRESLIARFVKEKTG
jgi:hypothetical protein